VAAVRQNTGAGRRRARSTSPWRSRPCGDRPEATCGPLAELGQRHREQPHARLVGGRRGAGGERPVGVSAVERVRDRLVIGTAGPRGLEQPVEIRTGVVAAACHHALDLPDVRDVGERVGADEQQIRGEARHDAAGAGGAPMERARAVSVRGRAGGGDAGGAWGEARGDRLGELAPQRDDVDEVGNPARSVPADRGTPAAASACTTSSWKVRLSRNQAASASPWAFW
jgi:hypothetical protein